MLRHMPTLKGTPADSPTGKHPQDFTTYRVLAWRIPGMGAWWAAVYGVAQSRTRLKRLSSSSSSNAVGFMGTWIYPNLMKLDTLNACILYQLYLNKTVKNYFIRNKIGNVKIL